MNIKTGVIVFLFLLFISVGFASALAINPGTILNTTQSNSSLNFSFEVNVSYMNVEPNYIYLENVSYNQSGVPRFCASINYSSQDSILDSSEFNCGAASSPSGSGSGGSSSLPVYPSSFYINQADLISGYTKEFETGSEISFPFENENKTLYVGTISNGFVILSLSNGMSRSLGEGKTWDVDLNKNNLTDFSITLNSLRTNFANLTLRYVEEKFGNVPENNVSGNNVSGIFDFFNGENNTPGHVIIGSGVIILLLAILFILIRLIVRKKKSKYL